MNINNLEMVEKSTRTLMRTFGPQIAPTRDVAASKCLTCNPPPKLLKCPICDWETERWRFGLHIATYPKWCRERGEKKARVWASKA